MAFDNVYNGSIPDSTKGLSDKEPSGVTMAIRALVLCFWRTSLVRHPHSLALNHFSNRRNACWVTVIVFEYAAAQGR